MNIRVIRTIAGIALIIIGVCLIPRIFSGPADIWYMIKWLAICLCCFVPAFFLLRMRKP